MLAQGLRAGTPPTLDQLVSAITPGASRQSMVSTLKVLERKNLVKPGYALRESRIHLVPELTSEGYRRGLLL